MEQSDFNAHIWETNGKANIEVNNGLPPEFFWSIRLLEM